VIQDLTQFPVGHNATNYYKWIEAAKKRSSSDLTTTGTKMFYEVEYEQGYEPFLLMNRSVVPSYDERFTGRYYNKVSHVWHLAHLGFKFFVLENAFVIHWDHPRPRQLQPPDNGGDNNNHKSSNNAESKRSDFSTKLALYRAFKASVRRSAKLNSLG
jgi:hypothetical protein